MVRVISQTTYDDVVNENITEFHMSPEEAIQDAIAQFEAQGVDLSNIIKDPLGNQDAHLVSATIAKLKDLCYDDVPDMEAVKRELEVLKSECSKDMARRMRAGKDGAYKLLRRFLKEKRYSFRERLSPYHTKFVLLVLQTLVALTDNQPDLLDIKGTIIIESILENVRNEDILLATLKLVSNCCYKHEMNRQNIMESNIAINFQRLLDRRLSEKIIREILLITRRLTLDDDVRHEFGKAHEHAKILGIVLIEHFKKLLKEKSDSPLVSDLLLTMSCVLVRNELCQTAGNCSLLDILVKNYDSAIIVQQAARLVATLAGNDDVKRDFMWRGIAPIIVSVLNRHSGSAATSAMLLKAITALTLREPDHSRKFFDAGVAEAIIEVMNIHPDDPNVQRNACWAVRNMVARCRNQNPKYLELGIEPILNNDFEKFKEDFGFDIKSTLSDLGCAVQLDEPWTGKGVQMKQ